MKYQDCVEAVQVAEKSAGGTHDSPRFTDANINPATGLATDYLNHFNDDVLGWRPMSYRQHFEASRFAGRDVAIAAYDAADPNLRERLDALAGTMSAVLEATRAAMSDGMPHDAAGRLANHAAARLKPMVARAGAVINGDSTATPPDAPQAIIDGLMKRKF
jgi:hypothetical protein